MGENVLHVYAASEIFEEIIVVFDRIGKENGVSKLRELLNEQNVLGRTPWNIMVDDVNASKEAVNRIMSYGVSVNTIFFSNSVKNNNYFFKNFRRSVDMKKIFTHFVF
jgi:hypothetical protein